MIKFNATLIRVLLIPPNYYGNDDFEARLSLSGKPETVAIFERYGNPDYFNLETELPSDHPLTQEFIPEPIESKLSNELKEFASKPIFQFMFQNKLELRFFSCQNHITALQSH